MADFLKNDFSTRHIGSDSDVRKQMLDELGLKSLDELLSKAMPSTLICTPITDLPSDGMSEHAALLALQAISKKNECVPSMIGMGYYNTLMPAVIKRNIFENPGWYSAYTPYQAEISQGRLYMLLVFQQIIIDLTGLPVANASLLDEATAACEAMSLCVRADLQNSANKSFFVDSGAHPQVLAVLKGRAQASGLNLIIDAPKNWNPIQTFGGILYYPNTYGEVVDHQALIKSAKQAGNKIAIGTDLMALLQLKSPGKLGADMAFGSSQRFGIPMGFGGPHAAFFAVIDDYKRLIPGRIIGVSKDVTGKPAYRMALQTREQHIRRGSATSNICTAQAFLAILVAAYVIYHGPVRLKTISNRIHQQAKRLAKGLIDAGFDLLSGCFFDTVCVHVPSAAMMVKKCKEQGINIRQIDDGKVSMSCDEMTSEKMIDQLIEVFKNYANTARLAQISISIPETLNRQEVLFQNDVFHAHQTETEFLRFVTRLCHKDFALDHSMIALGSCTMKLNAASEMEPISWHLWANMHPFAPKEQTEGYRYLIDDFESMICACTGFDGVSVQPNSGAQGEYTGLLMIRNCLKQKGQGHRHICLIPASAHGTNPASAVMAGMKVVVVNSDTYGNVDLLDLKNKATLHANDLAACMITYPSTHGVFESDVQEVCNVVHQHGGMVYLDGANLNAMVGCVFPSALGFDVMHINLHKTFCIPHGGGGPGVGVVAAVAELKPFLPPVEFFDKGLNFPVSAAPYGSALILCISWMYIKMMGSTGLSLATSVAILNANYMRARLSKQYKILYSNDAGYVAHEFIVDLREIKKTTGISEHDIAKRLMDYGFHAPTVSFPVSGGLMIEPTESESKAQLDIFCDAMLCIFNEIEKVRLGVWPADNNPLKNAPHTQAACVSDQWDFPYSRKEAAFPMAHLNVHKKWPSVARIDEVFGDRNLICACQ